jgi:lipase chaperone LimK
VPLHIKFLPSRRRWLAAGAALGLSLAVWWGWQAFQVPEGSEAALNAVANSASSVASSVPRSPDQLRAVLAAGALRGTKPYGDWCVSADKGLQPCLALRDRFEYYINGVGDITLAEVRVIIGDEALRAHGVQQAAEIITVYDRYWAARTYNFVNRVDMNDPVRWKAALDERHQVRKQSLGEAWAEAFYGEEERQAMLDYERVKAGKPAPSLARKEALPRMDSDRTLQAMHAELVRRYGEAGADRIEQQEMAQAKFKRSVSVVRQEWMRISNAPGLSDQERQAQLKRFVEQRVDPVETQRVMMLARMAPP